MSSTVDIDIDILHGLIVYVHTMSSRGRPIAIRSSTGSLLLEKRDSIVTYLYVYDNTSYSGVGSENDVMDRVYDMAITILDGDNPSISYTVPINSRRESIPSSVSGGNPGTLLTSSTYDGNSDIGTRSNYGSNRLPGTTYGITRW